MIIIYVGWHWVYYKLNPKSWRFEDEHFDFFQLILGPNIKKSYIEPFPLGPHLPQSSVFFDEWYNLTFLPGTMKKFRTKNIFWVVFYTPEIPLFYGNFRLQNFILNELAQKCLLILFWSFWCNLTTAFWIFKIRWKMTVLEFFEFLTKKRPKIRKKACFWIFFAWLKILS